MVFPGVVKQVFSDAFGTSAISFAKEPLRYTEKSVVICATMRKPILEGYPAILIGYMRVSSDSDRQSTVLQREMAAGDTTARSTPLPKALLPPRTSGWL